MVPADGPEETEARRKGIHVDTRIDTRAQIVHAVGQRVGQLDVGGGTSLRMW